MYEMNKEIVSIREEISACWMLLHEAQTPEGVAPYGVLRVNAEKISLEAALTRADNIVLLVEKMGYPDLLSFVEGPYKDEVYKCFRSLGHGESAAESWTRRHISTPIWVARQVDTATAAD